MTDQYQIDYEILFGDIPAERYVDGDIDLGLKLPCGLGAKPVRYTSGQLTSEIDLQPLIDGRHTPGYAHATVHSNGSCTIPSKWEVKLDEADIEILLKLAGNIAGHPRPVK